MFFNAIQETSALHENKKSIGKRQYIFADLIFIDTLSISAIALEEYMNILERKMFSLLIMLTFIFAMFITAGCGDGSTTTLKSTIAAPGGPAISSISPDSGVAGSSITITGKNFSSTASNNIVKFGETQATVTSVDSGSLTVTVPSTLAIGSKYTVSVTVDSVSNNAVSTFKFLSSTAVTITDFSPVYGLADTEVTLTGCNFETTAENNIVTLNGSAGFTATVTAATEKSLTFKVPSGATSGSVTITNKNGTVTSSKNFTVSKYNIREWTFDSLTESPAVENYVFDGGLIEVSGKSLVGANARSYYDIEDVKDSVSTPSAKSINRLQLIKNGSKTVNSIGVPLEGACTVYIAALSAGSNDPRNLTAVDSSGTVLLSQTLPVSGTATAPTYTFTYSGSAGYIYLYTTATGGNISLYYIGVEYK
jgi:hypothetical protein